MAERPRELGDFKKPWVNGRSRGTDNHSLKERKGKEEYLYSTILADTTLAKRSDIDRTVLPANYTTSANLKCHSANMNAT